MIVSLWYVYLDGPNAWLDDDNKPTELWVNAKEFHSKREAKKVAEEQSGVVMGWFQ